MPRILYLIEALDLGGAEQVVIRLARGLDRSQFQPVVCCLTTRGRFAPLLEEAGVPLFCLDKRPKLDWPLISRLKKLIRDQRVDLIHSHLFTANLWGRLAARVSGAPIVVTEHSVDAWKGWPHLWLDRGLNPLTTHWVFVSRQVRDFYERRLGPLGERATVIANGVALPERGAPPAGRRPVTLATVGRLAPEKEQVRFVELLGDLHREGLPVRGLIVGEGPQRAAIEQLVRARGLERIVELTGLVTSMEGLWAQVDLFCLTSSREGLPLTALEAMAHGIPVLATSVGGIPECVQEGVEGTLVPFGDWEKFRVQARRLIQDEALRRRMGQAGRARVENQFSERRMVERHHQLYANLLRR